MVYTKKYFGTLRFKLQLYLDPDIHAKTPIIYWDSLVFETDKEMYILCPALAKTMFTVCSNCGTWQLPVPI